MRKLITLLVLVTLAAIAVPALGATRTVRLDDNVFRPSSLTIRSGDLVRFRWVGSNPHNVRAVRGPGRVNSGSARVRDSYSRRFRSRGTYRLVCDVHSRMRMTLRVR